jgi:hypothetical protein
MDGRKLVHFFARTRESDGWELPGCSVFHSLRPSNIG